MGQSDLVTAPVRTWAVGGLASPGEVGGRWQGCLRDLWRGALSLEHGALLEDQDTGVSQPGAADVS